MTSHSIKTKLSAIERYRRGEKVGNIAHSLGVNRHTITAWAQEAGVGVHKPRLTEEQRATVLRLVGEEGHTPAAAARAVGITLATAYRLCLDAGLTWPKHCRYLPWRQEVVRLVRDEGWTPAEAARALGLSYMQAYKAATSAGLEWEHQKYRGKDLLQILAQARADLAERDGGGDE